MNRVDFKPGVCGCVVWIGRMGDLEALFAREPGRS